ncbi:MAG: hypothetical protein KDA44_08645 [Planctomycetales bacterium]|nr:hypothetical protein [Planctomycetales bacterium]
MAILIGVDEAGYGPNLGPLVVAATAWRVTQGSEVSDRRSKKLERAAASPPAANATAALPATAADAAIDLYALLRDAVTANPGTRRETEAASTALQKGTGAQPAASPAGSNAEESRASPVSQRGERLAIADSKRLYKPGGGWRLLERGVLAARALLAENGDRLSASSDHAELIASLGADPHGARGALPWQHGDPVALPRDAAADDVLAAAKLLDAACASAGVQLLAIRARLVDPAEFNELVDRHGTKGAALSHVTLSLVRQMVDNATGTADAATANLAPPPSQGGARGGSANDATIARRLTVGESLPRPLPARQGGHEVNCHDTVHITCDKHGGRNRYAGLLQHHFPDSWIDVLAEGRSASRYAWQHAGAACEACFRVGGEAVLPTALASMTAKYLRELAMHEFNAFWTARVPGTKPTAGYPVDARRFKAQIAAAQSDLGIDDRVIWRNR